MKIFRKLAIGTSSYGSVVSKKTSIYIIENLINEGVLYIDTSPYYGIGQSEKIIGECVKKYRSKIQIATKFGIQSPIISKTKLKFLPIARKIYNIPFIKSYRKNNFIENLNLLNINQIKASVDNSLFNLNTEYLDKLLIHVNYRAYLENNELIDYLYELKYLLKVKSLGITSNVFNNNDLLYLSNFKNLIDTIQIPFSEYQLYKSNYFETNVYSIFSQGMPNTNDLQDTLKNINGKLIFQIQNPKKINTYLNTFKI